MLWFIYRCLIWSPIKRDMYGVFYQQSITFIQLTQHNANAVVWWPQTRLKMHQRQVAALSCQVVVEVIPIRCECSFSFVKYRKALKFPHSNSTRYTLEPPALKATEAVDFVEGNIRAETPRWFCFGDLLGSPNFCLVWQLSERSKTKKIVFSGPRLLHFGARLF